VPEKIIRSRRASKGDGGGGGGEYKKGGEKGMTTAWKNSWGVRGLRTVRELAVGKKGKGKVCCSEVQTASKGNEVNTGQRRSGTGPNFVRREKEGRLGGKHF